MKYNFLMKDLGWTTLLHFAVEDDNGKAVVEGGYCSHVKQELYDFAALAIKTDYYPDAKIVSVWNVERFRVLTEEERVCLEEAVGKKMTDENIGKTATREHIVTDMGNGGAFCSHCRYDLGSDPFEIIKIKKCPGCGYTLYEGGIYINGGGSDF